MICVTKACTHSNGIKDGAARLVPEPLAEQ